MAASVARIVESSAIRAVDYDAEREILSVTFVTGRTYLYSGVPAELYAGMTEADSAGRFFNRFIRDRFAFRERSTRN